MVAANYTTVVAGNFVHFPPVEEELNSCDLQTGASPPPPSFPQMLLKGFSDKSLSETSTRAFDSLSSWVSEDDSDLSSPTSSSLSTRATSSTSAEEEEEEEVDDSSDDSTIVTTPPPLPCLLQPPLLRSVEVFMQKDTPSPSLSRCFIVYLQPRKWSVLKRIQNDVQEAFGFDESWLYPIHCSLTSFFTVTAAAGAAASADIGCALGRGLTKFMEELPMIQSASSSSSAATIGIGSFRGEEGNHSVNSRLKLLKVAADNSLIIPIDFGGSGGEGEGGGGGSDFKSRIADYITDEIIHSNEKSDMSVQSTRGEKGSGIRVKQGSHITLLGQRSRKQPINSKDIHNAALKIESHICSHKTERSIAWDIVIHELIKWGNLEEKIPHQLVERARLNNIGMLHV